MAADPSFDPGRILVTLERHGVDYVLVGGLGARAHGALRPTSDIDCVPDGSAANLDRLMPAVGFRSTAVPPKLEGAGTFTVRAFATLD